MASDQVKRKLAAIFSADVKGYSRLMGEDEEWTMRTLNTYKGLIRNLVEEHQGRIVDGVGDNILAEFASVVDAVQCAVEIQQMLKAKNATLPDSRKMDFRIGINLGDVIEEEDSIYGDGVNIAARLEALAEPGGICISGTAYDQVENKIPLYYDFLGEKEVKNIVKPVRVYRVIIEPEDKFVKSTISQKPVRKGLSRWAIGLIAIVMIAGGVAVYQFVFRSSVSKPEVASIKSMAYPLPDKPSIAVLPFVNMSGDPQQEFFSDGITENIITALSKIPKLFVIARNSTFTYKGKSVKVKQVSEDLGVRYVLEGSVQRSGDQVRITAQLIDALNGHHLWSERYDRDLKDLFALQDEVTLRILSALQVKLTEGEQASIREKFLTGKQDLERNFKLVEAAYFQQQMSIEGNNKARRIAEEMVTKWPENPTGYLMLGWSNILDIWLFSTRSPRESLEKALELAQKVQSMDDSNPYVHGLLSIIYSLQKEHEKSIAEAERAVALNPGGANAHESYATSLYFACRWDEAINVYQKAIRLNPVGNSNQYNSLGVTYWAMGRFEEALSAFKKAVLLSPENLFPHINMAGTYMVMGREKEARAEVAEVLRINPKYTLNDFVTVCSIFKCQSEIDRMISFVRKAGLK
jgi:adenylate cyclase